MSNMGKGAGYYLTRSKSLLIDTAIVAILAIFMSFAMQMDALQSKGEDYLVLMLYAVIFGLTSLQSGAMIVDLTAKDKLSRRIEFFAASGIAVKESIKYHSTGCETSKPVQKCSVLWQFCTGLFDCDVGRTDYRVCESTSYRN